MNSLLNRVERIVSTSNFALSIADTVLNLIAPKAMAMAGCPSCTSCNNCKRTCYVYQCPCGEVWCCDCYAFEEPCQPC